VRHEVVAAARPQDRALVGAQPADAERQDEREHERDQRHRGSTQRDQPGGLGQLVHAGAVYERTPAQRAGFALRVFAQGAKPVAGGDTPAGRNPQAV